MAQQWTSQDAWVLGALSGTSAESTASLWEVIAHADVLEHQVIEEAEFTTSAGRLLSAELIGTDGTAYWHTDAGRELFRQHGRQKEKLVKGLRKWGDAPPATPLELAVGEFDTAADEYLARAQKIIDDMDRKQ